VKRLRVALLCLLPFEILAQGASPEINEQYRNPDYSRWQRSLETEGREAYEKRLAIVDATAPQPGQAIADVGAGTGLFTRLLALGSARKVASTRSTSRASSSTVTSRALALPD
jgi:hypothetical protein